MAIGDDITQNEVDELMSTQEGMPEAYARDQLYRARIETALTSLHNMPAPLFTSAGPEAVADLLSALWAKVREL